MRGGLRLLSQERLLLRAVLSRVGTIAQALEWDDCPVHDTQDNGIDLMAQTAEAGEWWAIQCERYDGGAVYMGREWREACGPGVRRSMSRRARSPDNARAVRGVLPAAPFVIAAYVGIWLALAVYAFVLSRRAKCTERDLGALKQALVARKEKLKR